MEKLGQGVLFFSFPVTATIEKVCGFSEPLTYYLAAAGII